MKIHKLILLILLVSYLSLMCTTKSEKEESHIHHNGVEHNHADSHDQSDHDHDDHKHESSDHEDHDQDPGRRRLEATARGPKDNYDRQERNPVHLRTVPGPPRMETDQ